MVGNTEAGALGERIAADYLRLAGCEILERNFRSDRVEIDIVAREGGCIAFVEVKMRRGGAFGGAIEAVDRRKIAHLRAAARRYLAERPAARGVSEYRFDLVAIDLGGGRDGMIVRHLRGIG